jgi:parallel beta-helix repeat protein
MSGCLVEENLINGVNARAGTVTLSGNRIVANRRGLYLQKSRAVVEGNDLSGNSEHGIFLEEGDVELHRNRMVGNGRAGVRWVNAAGRFTGNALYANGEYALINDGSGAIAARANWWGDSSPSRIATVIRDGSDRAGMGLVDAGDPLTQALPWVTPVTPASP